MGACAVPHVIINSAEKKDIHQRTASVTRLPVLFKQRKAHGPAHRCVLAARNDNKNTRNVFSSKTPKNFVFLSKPTHQHKKC
jgi:hypothetical protein